jgi:Domain of unknown function (DUF222)
MCTATAPASAAEAVRVLHAGLALQRAAAQYLAAYGAADLPAEAMAQGLRALECADAAGAAARGVLMGSFDAQDGPAGDGQRTMRTWLVNVTRVTRGQAAEHRAVQKVAEDHPVLLAGLAAGGPLTTSEALQVARWLRPVPAEYRDTADRIVVAAARKGVDLRGLAAICAELRARTAKPDPDGGSDSDLDRGVSFDTTFEGAGVLRGDLTPGCATMVQAVLDALSAPAGGGDVRTRPQRLHDALEEAMRRLLASDLLPQRAGQPVKALVHIYFTDLCQLDAGSALQKVWIGEYRARWAAARGAASVCAGDGGAWLEGDKARAIACDAMLIPVVLGDIDPGAIEDLIGLCVRYHQLRTQGCPDSQDASCGPATARTTQTQDGIPGLAGSAVISEAPPVPAGLTGTATRQADLTAAVADMLAGLEQQIIGKVLQVVSGPGGVASFLRRNLLGKGLGGPSLPLDVGQDDTPVHLRRLVALRDQTCQYPGGCDQPASGCEAHHVVHRADGGPTSLANLKGYCWFHHHIVLHQLGWVLTANPDGTSQVKSPAGKTIRSHHPPPSPDDPPARGPGHWNQKELPI